MTTYLVDNKPSNQHLKVTIFLGQPPDTHHEIPHATGIKPSIYHRRIRLIALSFKAWRDEALRGRGVWHQSLQTEGIARGGGG